MKIEDQEGKAGKIFLNTTSANLPCSSSTLGLHGKPGINYQQYGSFFRLKYTICVQSSLLLRIIGGMCCELGLTSEHCYNIVRNTLILNMTKPRKRVFRFPNLQTVVQQKLVSTIWSLFIETYTYINISNQNSDRVCDEIRHQTMWAIVSIFQRLGLSKLGDNCNL